MGRYLLGMARLGWLLLALCLQLSLASSIESAGDVAELSHEVTTEQLRSMRVDEAENTDQKDKPGQVDAQKLSEQAVEISKGALACAQYAAKTKRDLMTQLDQKNSVIERLKMEISGNKVQREKLEAEVAANAETTARLQRTIDGMTGVKGLLKERIADLEKSGQKMAMGLTVQGKQKAKLEETGQESRNAMKQLQLGYDKLKKKTDRMKDMEAKIAASDRICDDRIRKEADASSAKISKALSKSAISTRALELCKADLQAAQSAGASMKVAAMKHEAMLADQADAQKQKMQEVALKVKREVTDAVRKEEMEKCDKAIEKTVSRVSRKSNKPLSKKCRVCAKLGEKERDALNVNCE